jgi:hypothetical protein
MIDPFTRTRFNPDLKLETWFPEGVLDDSIMAFMMSFVGFDERVIDRPFNRFVDMSKLTAIDLDFMKMADLAAKRCEAYKDQPPVKTALLTVSAPAYATGRKLPYLTRLDAFILMSSVLDFLSLIEVMVTTKFANYDRTELARTIDRRCRWIFPLIFAIATTVIFLC